MNQNPLRAHSGALAGAAFIALTQICTKDNIDYSLRTSVFIFAIMIPLLVATWFRPPDFPANAVDFAKDSKNCAALCRVLLLHLGVISGFVAFFFHFGWIAGSLFLGSTILAFKQICGFPWRAIWQILRALPRLAFHRRESTEPGAPSTSEETKPKP